MYIKLLMYIKGMGTQCSKVCSKCNYCKDYSLKGISQTDTGIMEILKIIDASMTAEFPRVLDK